MNQTFENNSKDSSSFDNLFRCLWEKILIPDLNKSAQVLEDSVFHDSIPNVRMVDIENADFVVPDPKAFRSMSRASLFLSSYVEEMRPILNPYLERNPFSVGIYCAVENGPIDGPSTSEILNRSGETYDFKFSEAYRKLRNPKMYLKQLPNLVPAQLGISMGIQGPMNVYTHSISASEQSLEQAKYDLLSGFVEVALVMASHAFDDFWVVKRSRKQDPRILCEGAALKVLTLGACVGDINEIPPMKKCLNNKNLYDKDNYFGIADGLINLIRKGE